MERLDDPSLGDAGRFRPGMRITAWNSGLWYARATNASLWLMSILAYRMQTEDTWDQSAFGEEMSRPARDDHLAAGITKRALNHWCLPPLDDSSVRRQHATSTPPARRPHAVLTPSARHQHATSTPS